MEAKLSGLVAQWLEHTLDKRGVGGSNPPGPTTFGPIAQLGERRFCKAEVIGSIPIGSKQFFQFLFLDNYK